MIVCVKCQRKMRPKKNSVDLIELMSDGEPYKLWDGDLWECQDCGTEVVYTGPHQTPVKEHYQPGFKERIESEGAKYYAKEWSR